MSAAQYDITIEQGASFRLSLRLRNSSGEYIDFTGYAARMQVRETKDAASAVLDLTSTGGDITLASDGTVTVLVDATDTAALDVPSAGYGYYDLEIESAGGEVDRWLEGRAFITAEVTR